jgi:hypothetical protein
LGLYEVVLRTARGDEVRVGEKPYVIGQIVTITGAAWSVIAIEPPATDMAMARYVLAPADAAGNAPSTI